MPKVKVNGKVKHFPYTAAGKAAAARARKKNAARKKTRKTRARGMY